MQKGRCFNLFSELQVATPINHKSKPDGLFFSDYQKEGTNIRLLLRPLEI
jgi:hypothetical protein